MNRLAIAAVLFAVTFASGLYLGKQWGRTAGVSREAALLSKQMDAVLAEQAEDRKRSIALQKKLDRLPRSQGVIREVVRENPSGCVLPPAVADGLREAIRKANASRALPTDS